MNSKILNEQISESFSTKESEKIYGFCISLVSSSLKDLENEWYKKINNNKFKKDIIQSLFSLLYYQILLIQQISKYYNLYVNNLDEDNIKLINQIININKELMNKKIKTIINIDLYRNTNTNTNEKYNKINEEKILNYKISQFNENENKSKLIKTNDKNIKYISYKETTIKANNSKNNNSEINKHSLYEEINHKNRIINIKQNKIKEEIKNNSIISYNYSEKNKTKKPNKLNLKNIVINKNYNLAKNKTKNNKDHLKRSNTEKIPVSTNGGDNTISELSNNERIKINLADKFLKNNENNDFATLSNLSRQSKKSVNNNLCLTQTTFNYNKKDNSNTYTIQVEENPFRKVKNIILNAKNLLFIKTNTPTNINIVNKYRYTSYDTNRKYDLSEEVNKIYTRKHLKNLIQKHKSKIFSLNNSSQNFYIKNIDCDEVKKSMSNKDFLNMNNNKKNKEEQKDIDNKNIKTQNKERECRQILKDGMKKMEKSLNSKDKKDFNNNKSKDYFAIIKKMINKNNSNNKGNKNF